MAIRNVQIYLTEGQCKYLGGLKDATHAKAPWDPSDTVISMVADDGWIFVEEGKSVGHEGSGVWVDVNGDEHHSSGQGHPTSAEAMTYYRANT
jgi:hypothetical protein